MNKKICKELIIVGIITLFFTFWILKVWSIKLEIPIAYSGDGLFLSYNVKNIQDFGWWFTNSNTGAPFNSKLYDYPFYFDSLFLFIFKLILVFVKNWGKAINIFYIGIFPTTSVISYYVMRKLKINIIKSFLGSLYFTFLPYRFFRGGNHFYLSCYFLIPLMFLFLYGFYTSNEKFKIKEFIRKYKKLLLLILIPLGGIYYTFFFCFFLIITFISKKNLNKINFFNKLYEIICYYVIIFFTMFLMYIPGLIYRISNGKNIEAPNRSPIEADVYSLTISRLFISSKYTNVLGFHRIKSEIEEYLKYLTRGEGTGTEYLGFIGIIGFLCLIILLFIKFKKIDNKILLIRNLNISAILLSVASGFGFLFALIISPQIRAYNRISVFIAYFSILCICLFLSKAYKNINSIFYKRIFKITIILLFSLSILEQIPDNITYKDSRIKYSKNFNSDKAFVENIEKQLGDKGMVFQLPYFKFPENGNINKLGDYELFKGYLFSKNLKWSYGGYRGRESDQWNAYITSLPINEILEKISIVGFNGLYIDKKAYTQEEFSKLENKIKNLIKKEPYVSSNNELVFFNLTNYNNLVKSKYTKEQLLKEREKILSIISDNGIYSTEVKNNKKWRWTKKNFEFIISNQNPNSEFSLEADIFSGYPQDSELLIDYNGEKQKIIINDKGTKLKLNYKLSIGKNIIKFTTNAPKINAPGDNRKMYLRFENLKINE